MDSRAKSVRYLVFAAFGLAVFCTFLSFSRSSWIGCSLILVGLLFIYPKATIRLTIILVMVVYILSGSLLAEEIAFGYERLTGEAAKESAEARVIIDDAMVKTVKTKPFFGWGYGNHYSYLQQFTKRVGNIPAARGSHGASHNTFLTIMSDLGVIAFLMYTFPVILWLILSVKGWRQLPSSGFFSRRLLAMLWLLMLHMTTVSNFMDMSVHPSGLTVWWMALGFIANMVYPYLNPDKVGAPRWLQPVVRRNFSSAL